MEIFSPEWFLALWAIILIDLLLAGDNAIVIALAARNLPPVWQRRAVVFGTMGAIVVRIVLVLFVTKLLTVPGLGAVGGLILYVIAWNMMRKPPQEEEQRSAANSFWAAMGTIIVADTVMGLDNVLAIAAAARGDFWLVAFGLGLSIPIMMFGSVIILKLLDKAPWLVAVGSGVLAVIAGRIILDDAWVKTVIDWPAKTEPALMEWTAALTAAAALTIAALWRARQVATAK